MPANNPRIPFQLLSERPNLKPLKDKPLMVHIVVNLEVWPFDQAMPRAILVNPHGKSPIPDIGNFSWVEYGLRTGVPRLIRMFSARGLPVTNMMNAALPDYYPSCAEAALKAGWELTGHGLFQRSLLYEKDEEAVIEESLVKFEKFSGKRPRGWLGPGYGESLDTPDLLTKHGIEFLHDWMVDDTPCWMRTRHGPLLAVPYALDMNDVMTFVLDRHPPEEYYKKFKAAADYFAAEPGTPPRVITMGLHPHIIAVPFRLAVLERTIDMLMERKDTVFVTGGQIADWYEAQDQEGRKGTVARKEAL
jgi:peptidoglycan/xylan/chitin deacetylase (PgdA/CDA1 family)